MDDTTEQLAVARYLQLESHDNILLRWVSKKPDKQRALGLLQEIGKARSAPGCLALRGQRPLGGEPGGLAAALDACSRTSRSILRRLAISA